MSTVTSDFYVLGGTLRRDAPSYVKRQADDNLYNGLSAGQYCYVLTSRQMGKSSLMVRTAVRLRADDVSVAVLDLTAIGQNVTAEQWYEGLLGLVGQQLNLEDELEDFWLDNKRIGPLQRWMRAIREVVMTRKPGRIVIFVDEIDAVRSLSFSTDEFFAGIREFYNRRTEDEELTRLAFCLLGVATPSDLIRDTRTTPFNIGQRIELTDFAEAEAATLAQGLNRDERLGHLLLQRILYWTGGHPYLTQRLCQSAAVDDSVSDAEGVDRLCAKIFLSSRARERDDNLLFVRERMLRSEDADRASLLDLYQQVRKNKRIPDDETNALISVLRLSGITRSVGGYLHVRNQIYYRVFDRDWVIANMPDAELRRQRAAYRKGLWRAAAIAALILLVMGALAGTAVYQRVIAERNARELQTALADARQQKEIAEARKQEAEQNQQAALAAKAQAIEAEKRASDDAARARIAEQEAAANATRAATALKLAEEQKKIAVRNEERAIEALRDAEAQKQAAERSEQVAKESERRLRKQSLKDNLTIYNLADKLEQVSAVKERPYWSTMKGMAQGQMGYHEGAIREYTKTLAVEQDNITALQSRSYEYLVTGQPEKTVEDALATLKINPSSAIGNLNISIGLSLLGRYEEAATIMREKGIPTFTHMGYGEYPQSYISPEIQEATGRRVIDADGETALTALHYELANIRAFAGGEDFEAALAMADKRPRSVNAYLFALNWAWMNYQKRPQDYGALAAQGALWERAGFKDRALRMYQDFQTRYQAQPDERRYAGLVKWVNLRIAALQNTVPRSPVVKPQTEQLDARDLYVKAYESLLGGGPDTLNFITRTVEADAGNVDYLIQRAQFLYNSNDFVGARNDCDVIVKLAPRTAIAYVYRALANIGGDLGAPTEAILKDIREAKEFDPAAVPNLHDTNFVKLSETLAQINPDEALDLLERTAKHNYPSPKLYVQMAKLLNEKRRNREALEKIKVALAIRSDETELYDERKKAEEALCAKKESKDAACPNQAEILRRQATAYKEVGDALLSQGKTGAALDTYAKSLRILNDLAEQKNLPDIQCDINVTLSTVARIIEEQGTRAKAMEYLETEFSDMKNLKASLDNVMKSLSNSN